MTLSNEAIMTQQIQGTNVIARLKQNGRVDKYKIKELPEKFFRWQLDYKREIYDAIEKDDYIALNAGHLPVVGTWDSQSRFPKMANKGVGFTPKDDYIDHYVDLVEDAVEKIEHLPPHAVDDTRVLRIATAREFYAHPEHIDRRRLALLELFEGSTLRNLSANPICLRPLDWQLASFYQLSSRLRCRNYHS